MILLAFTFIKFLFANHLQTDSDSTVLDLCSKKLKIIPDSVFNKTELKVLNLGACIVEFYPPLSALKPENANELKDISDKIENLVNLEVLILNTNQLTSLPPSITKLKKLKILDLSINKDLDIVKELDKIKQLPNLEVLKVIDTKVNKSNIDLIKKSLNPNLKVIVRIDEYFKY